jgi:NADPH2 dehydrogenase
LISNLHHLGLAYLHLIEPRVSGNADTATETTDSIDFALEAWQRSGPVILAGGYTAQSAGQALRTRLQGDDF